MQEAVAFTQNEWILKNYNSTRESEIKEGNDVIWDEKVLKQAILWEPPPVEPAGGYLMVKPAEDYSLVVPAGRYSLVESAEGYYTLASTSAIMGSAEPARSDYTFASELTSGTSCIGTKVPDVVKRIVKRPKPTTSKGRFILLQQWEGTVLEISEDTFTSLIYDQTDPQNEPEEVVLLLEEISPNDRPLLQEGAIFYWSIGYDDLPNGQRKRTSNIRFRRLPAWGKKEIDKIMEKSSALYAFLRSENPDSVRDVAS